VYGENAALLFSDFYSVCSYSDSCMLNSIVGSLAVSDYNALVALTEGMETA